LEIGHRNPPDLPAFLFQLSQLAPVWVFLFSTLVSGTFLRIASMTWSVFTPSASSLEVEQDAMSQRGMHDGAHIVDRGCKSAIEECRDLSAEVASLELHAASLP